MRQANIGCGEFYVDGWVNTDVLTNDEVQPDRVCSILHMPFEDNSFDRVYAGHVLEHIERGEQMRRALNEVKRVLAPGGQFMVVGPDIARAKLTRQPHSLINRIIKGERRWEGDVHHWTCTESRLIEVLSDNGFECTRMDISQVPPEWPVVSRAKWQCAVLAQPVGEPTVADKVKLDAILHRANSR